MVDRITSPPSDVSDTDPGALKKEQFPHKLHRLLDDAEEKAFVDIIAWSPEGTSFRVFSKERFEDEVMGAYFGSTKYRSFQRTLNLWGFQVCENKKIGNENFVRGDLQRCSLMKRIKVKGVYHRRPKTPAGTSYAVKQASSPTALPKKGESILFRHLPKPVLPITSSEAVMWLPRQKAPDEGVARSSATKVVNASVLSSLQSALGASSETRSLLSLMCDEANNRYKREAFIGGPRTQRQVLTSALAVMRSRTGRPYYGFDPQHRRPNAFAGTSMISNIMPGMLHRHNFPARSSEAIHQAIYNMNLPRSSRMEINRNAALSLQSTIDNVCRLRLMAACEKAAVSSLLRRSESKTPDDGMVDFVRHFSAR